MSNANTQQLKWVSSFGKKPLLAYKGYLYRMKGQNIEKRRSYWACANAHKKPRCSATLVVSGDVDGPAEQLRMINAGHSTPHTCGAPNAETKTAYNDMRSAAANSRPSGDLGKIYDTTLHQSRDDVVAKLPKRKSVINNLRIVRQKTLNIPPPPRGVSGFDIPPEYSSTTIGGVYRNTLVYDSGRDDTQRILIWADIPTMQNLVVDTKVLHLSMDGTFKRCPGKWHEQYTVLIRHECGRMVPCIFCLLPQRDYVTYRRVFDVLLQLLGPDVSSCVFDMERAAVKAFLEVWPRSRVVICLFHFGQALYRKFGALKLWTSTDDALDANREKAFYNLMSLPFLPTSKLLLGFRFACANLPHSESETIMTYFRSQYGFLKFFAPQLWGQRDRVLEDLPRTNNGQEGFHRRWNGLFRGTAHPNLWVWIDTVHDVFAANRLELVRYGVGDFPQRKSYYVRTDQLLYDLCSSPTDDLTEATIGDWFDRARAITRRLVPRSDLKEDFDDLFFDMEESQGTQPDGGVVLHVPVDDAPGESQVEATPVCGEAEEDLVTIPLQPESRPGAVQGSSRANGEAGRPSVSQNSQASSLSDTWVEHNVDGARWVLTEEDHVELMREGEMVADRVVDTWMMLLWRKSQAKMSKPESVTVSRVSFEPAPEDGMLLLQPVFINQNHFAGVIRTAGPHGDIFYADSMARQVPENARLRLRELFGPNRSCTFVGVQQQSPLSNLCALHTIARLTQVVLCRSDPMAAVFDEAVMRSHVEKCLLSGDTQPFPLRRGRRPKPPASFAFRT